MNNEYSFKYLTVLVPKCVYICVCMRVCVCRDATLTVLDSIFNGLS